MNKLISMAPLLLLTGLTTTQGVNAQTWGGFNYHHFGFGPYEFHHWGFHHFGPDCCGDDNDPNCCSPPSSNCCNSGPIVDNCNAYCQGADDASYDVQNNLPYQPVGSCLPCHSQDYWNSFHQGYDSIYHQQQQQSSQGSSINIYGNNYVQTNQDSGQSQSPLQTLGHLVCGWVNCGNQGPLPQQTGYVGGP